MQSYIVEFYVFLVVAVVFMLLAVGLLVWHLADRWMVHREIMGGFRDAEVPKPAGDDDEWRDHPGWNGNGTD